MKHPIRPWIPTCKEETLPERFSYSLGTIMYGCSWNAGSGYRYGFNGKEGDDEFSVVEGSYDFGARMYDSRLGRWWTMDPVNSRTPTKTPYCLSLDSPIRLCDHSGKFEVDPTIQKKYPKVALLILNIDKIISGHQLPEELERALDGVSISTIFPANLVTEFLKYSGMSEQEFNMILEPNHGPLVEVRDLDFDDDLTNRKHLSEFDPITGYDTDQPRKREDGKEGLLIIDDDLLEALEFELGGDPSELNGLGGKGMDKEDLNRALKSFISTLFHESIHYGRSKTGLGNVVRRGEPNIHWSKVFEIVVWGEDVGRTTKDSLYPDSENTKILKNKDNTSTEQGE